MESEEIIITNATPARPAPQTQAAPPTEQRNEQALHTQPNGLSGSDRTSGLEEQPPKTTQPEAQADDSLRNRIFNIRASAFGVPEGQPPATRGNSTSPQTAQRETGAQGKANQGHTEGTQHAAEVATPPEKGEGASRYADLVFPFDEETLPSDVRAELNELVSDVTALRDQNAKLKKTLRQNEELIDQTLKTQTEGVQDVGISAGNSSQDGVPSNLQEKLDNLRTLVVEDGNPSDPGIAKILQMIEEKDLRGLRHLVRRDILQIFDLQGPGGGGPGGLGTTQKDKLEMLRMAILNQEKDSADSFQVQYVLHMIDAQDMEGLKTALPPEALQQFGLLDDSAGTDPQISMQMDRQIAEQLQGYTSSLGDGVGGDVMEQIRRMASREGRQSGMVRVRVPVGGQDAMTSLTNENVAGQAKKEGGGGGVNQVEIQTGRGHIVTIHTKANDNVTGMQFLPDLGVLCVCHFRHDTVGIYSEEGENIGLFQIPKMANPSGMTVLKSKPTSVIVSDFGEKNLHVITVARPDGGKAVMEDHKVWKVHFSPSDVTTFKGNKLAILSMETSTIHLMTEEGSYVDKIAITGRAIEKLYSAIVASSHIMTVDSSEPGALYWVNKTGKIIRSYGNGPGEEPLKKPMHVIEDNRGRFLVADQNNDRIHLVSKDGKFLQFLMQASDGVTGPRRLFLDYSKSRPRLFIGYGAKFDIKVRVHDYDVLCNDMAGIFDEEDGDD